MKHKLMTEREKADVYIKSIELEEAGQVDEAKAMRRTIPVPAHLAKVFKDKVGADFLIQGERNLSEAEVEYGSNWLTE